MTTLLIAGKEDMVLDPDTQADEMERVLEGAALFDPDTKEQIDPKSFDPRTRDEVTVVYPLAGG